MEAVFPVPGRKESKLERRLYSLSHRERRVELETELYSLSKRKKRNCRGGKVDVFAQFDWEEGDGWNNVLHVVRVAVSFHCCSQKPV
jgi:hypothetical protein